MKLRLLSILAVVALALSSAAAAQADHGDVQIRGDVATVAQVDPMEDFGVNPSAHLHTEAGAENVFSATTILPQMIDATASSFPLQSDHSMLWIPTPMTPAGTPATITNEAYYLQNNGYHLMAEPPNGLKVFAGNPHCTTSSCDTSAEYFCAGPNGEYEGRTIPTVADCNAGAGYQEEVFSPGQCWNGENYGPGLGSLDGPTGDSSSNYSKDPTCASGYVVPGIALDLFVGNDGLGGYLSSDVVQGVQSTYPGVTAHFNYVFGWEQNSSGYSAMDQIIHDCLNTSYNFGPATCVIDGNELYKSQIGSNGQPDGNPDLTQPVTN